MARVRIRPGSTCTTWWADDASGRFRARDYFDSLPPQLQASFDVLFGRLARDGGIRNVQLFNRESANIYCFKRGKHRLTCFQEGRDWMLLHGFKKKTNKDKRLKREIELAERLRTDHLDREHKGNKT